MGTEIEEIINTGEVTKDITEKIISLDSAVETTTTQSITMEKNIIELPEEEIIEPKIEDVNPNISNLKEDEEENVVKEEEEIQKLDEKNIIELPEEEIIEPKIEDVKPNISNLEEDENVIEEEEEIQKLDEKNKDATFNSYETEIIKTEDPNIVIERTTTDVEIDVSRLTERKNYLIGNISEIQSQISSLSTYSNLPSEVQVIVEQKIYELEIRISTDEIELLDINFKLDGSNV